MLTVNNIGTMVTKDKLSPGAIERVEDHSEKTEEEVVHQAMEIKTENTPAASSIRFGVVHIRTYPTIIGDNPSPSRGPPLEMDWKPTEQIIIPVDEYEKHRPPRRDNLLLSAQTRQDLLKELGFTQTQIDEAIQIKRQARILRQQTVHGLRWAWKEKQEERRDFYRRIFSCQSEKPLDYPHERNSNRDAYWDESHKIKPMFDRIPCTHCAGMISHGPGSDLPAMIYMYLCDGEQCKNQEGAQCPFTGQNVADLIREAAVEA